MAVEVDRGRGGRGGRGGRVDRGNRVFFNGVDVTDYTQTFSNEDMSKMGRDGRDYIFMRRAQRDGGRSGGRGRGRGHYDPPRQIEEASTHGDEGTRSVALSPT